MRVRHAAYIYDAVPCCAPQFTGKERDTETGLDYFGARYYGSNMGRFLSPDEFTGGPVSAFGGDPTPPGPLPYADIFNPQSLNKYSYTYNNPLRYVDPDGHDIKYTQAALDAGLDKVVASMRADSEDFNSDMQEFEGTTDIEFDSGERRTEFGSAEGLTEPHVYAVPAPPGIGGKVPVGMKSATVTISPKAKDIKKTIAHEANHAVTEKNNAKKGIPIPANKPRPRTFREYWNSKKERDARAHAEKVKRQIEESERRKKKKKE